MIEKSKISQLVEEAITDDKVFLVEVTVGGNNNIIIKLDGDNGVSIKQCVEVSKFVENSLDRDEEDFSIEVSSFGLNNEYKLKRQYFINKGKSVVVIDSDDKKHKGIMQEVNDDFIVVERRLTKKQKKDRVDSIIKLPYDKIKSTKTEILI